MVWQSHPALSWRDLAHCDLLTDSPPGDRVLVGLNSGALRIYRLNELPPPSGPNGSSSLPSSITAASPPNAQDNRPPSQSAQKATDLLREVEKFSPRAVE